MAENTTEMICINCPRGCRMQITSNGNDISVSGNYCSKGVTYAKQETTSPQRVLTVLMRPEGAARPLSVTDRQTCTQRTAEKMCTDDIWNASKPSGKIRRHTHRKPLRDRSKCDSHRRYGKTVNYKNHVKTEMPGHGFSI